MQTVPRRRCNAPGPARKTRPSMHAHRIAGEPDPSTAPPPWSDRVCGLGVCDALQLRLEPGQLPWLCDELEQLRLAHEQALGEATAAHAANEPRERALA